ncbi:MAG TPA: hypothetical protein VER11_06080 [Polyangiaceae bacterium]|nr:hypothetical protein [Polyangiaceae bacterium]
MAFAVVIDVPPIEAATAARTIATCNATLGPEQCVLASGNASADPPSRWYAVVRFGPDGEVRLTIELYDGNRDADRDGSHAGSHPGTRIASSELEFKERDSPEERWASAGVVVAALVLAQPMDRSPVEKQPAPPAPVAPHVPVTRAAPAPTAARWLRLDLGVTAGSEERGAPLRVGPLARVGLAFANAPVFACASGAYTLQSSTSTDLSWLTGSLGAGVRVSFAHERGALEARGEAVLETLGIEATDGQRTESARRTRVGPRFGLDLSGYLTQNWALLAGVEAGVLGPRVVIDVSGQTRELPPFAWGLISAVRYDFR